MKDKEVLASAKAALKDAFGPKADEHTVKVTSSPSPGLTPSDLNAIIKEVGGKSFVEKYSPTTREEYLVDVMLKEVAAQAFPIDLNSITSSLRPEALAETKKLMQTFHKRMEKYAKHLSIDGATIICVKLALHSPAEINIGTLPDSDQVIIQELINNTPFRNSKKFYAMMDELKDFQIIFSENREDGSIFYLFNTVIHPPLNKTMDVSVDANTDTIRIAGKEFPSREKLLRLAGVPASKNEDVVNEPSHRQAVSGRNAYEIRADVLQMAIEWTGNRDTCHIKNEGDVIELARKFYSFVENRR